MRRAPEAGETSTPAPHSSLAVTVSGLFHDPLVSHDTAGEPVRMYTFDTSFLGIDSAFSSYSPDVLPLPRLSSQSLRAYGNFTYPNDTTQNTIRFNLDRDPNDQLIVDYPL